MSTWQSLLSQPGEEVVAPWVGGKRVSRDGRTWTLKQTPREYGWYRFGINGGRQASLLGPADLDPTFQDGSKPIRGYLVGNRMIPDGARVPTPDKFAEETLCCKLVEEGLERVTRAMSMPTSEGPLVFIQTEFPLGPEDAVLAAYQDRKTSVADIPGVTPALDLAFRWMTLQREREEEWERRREAERLRREQEEARRKAVQEAIKSAGTGAGRRELAKHDFKAAAKAALAVSGAELLDTRNIGRDQVEVRYRFRHERLACVVDRATLQVIDAGVCLDDHHGTKGDTWFTLESLPVVVAEAMRLGKLVVWRHG